MDVINHVKSLAVFEAFCLCVFGVGCSSTSTVARDVDPLADQTMRQMSQALEKLNEFSIRVTVASDETLDSGQVIHHVRKREVGIRRPNRLVARGGEGDAGVRAWYDGKTLTLMDMEQGLYGGLDVPNNLKGMLDFVVEELDLTLPMADLVLDHPYDTLMAEVLVGDYIGLHQVEGRACHHLAFQQEHIDWQIWIESGDSPLPRKLLVTYRDLPGQPQVSSTIHEWNTKPNFSDQDFMFQPPDGARRMDIYELVDSE